jgi:uncharacterized protein
MVNISHFKRYFALILVAMFALSLSSNQAAAQSTSCGSAATLISAVQGSSATSPLNGNVNITIEGVVVGDFQKSDEMKGFFVQEENADANPATSEGIFVFDNNFGVEVSQGDVVRVQGDVTEFASSGQTLTQISKTTKVEICENGFSITPTEVNLPVSNAASWERYEGMLISFPQELTVSDTYNLGRFGEIILSQGGRLFQPTNLAAPGSAASAVQVENERRTILLDDANGQQNRDPVRYPTGGLSASNALRAGFTITDLMGILDQRFGTYRIQPVGDVNFVATNSRPTTSPDVGGNVRIASMNVLNYFNGNGQAGGFPTSRGADTLAEFNRQRDKIINTIIAIDPDVIGLMEMENDGYGANSAIQDLVNGLNRQTTPNTYAFIDPGFALGSDEIKVAILYQPARVTPIGAAMTTTTAPFNTMRPPMAQTFEHIESGEQFTVVVNHFKSKGSCPSPSSSNPNADQGDGQSCWNATRVESANTLTDWLATNPTGIDDPDILIIGDLNAYAKEDPITAIIDAGYTNLIDQFADNSYSYIFGAQSGYLDHALASESLVSQVSGAAEWHINADEPRVLDYNVEFKSTGQISSFYSSQPFRTSDHDPVIIGLELGTEAPMPTDTATSAPTATNTKSPTQTKTPTATDTEAPTETDTSAPTATDTASTTETPEPSETPTPEPTDTESPTETDTPAPTDTEAPSPTATSTPIPVGDTSSDNTSLIVIVSAILAAIGAVVGGAVFRRPRS